MRILLTGGTGFLGQYLLAELLRANHKVWCLYRNESRRLDTLRFLSEFGLPRDPDTLFWVHGDILEAAENWKLWCARYTGLDSVEAVLHSAASTRLHLNRQGEPIRTNLGSAKVLKELVKIQPMQIHLVSSAYVCGFIQGQRIMEVNHARGNFVTVYEESKWEAEQLWMGQATILRPSVIVGHSETGRCTSFSGWYIFFQAVQLYLRLMGSRRKKGRIIVNIDLPVNHDSVINIIPVDYVARAAVAIIDNQENHNRIFHLTHPNPPTHAFTKKYIEDRFGIFGVNLVGTGAPFPKPRNVIERSFLHQVKTILNHFTNNPIFDRTNTDSLGLDIVPPPITTAYMDRLLDYAIKHDWGNK